MGMKRLPGRPMLGKQKRERVEVTLEPQEVTYARKYINRTLSTAISMLINEHRLRNKPT